MIERAHDALLTFDRPHDEIPTSVFFPRLLEESKHSGRNPLRMALKYARAALGTGKLSPEEFFDLRLFDEKMYPGAGPREFLGMRGYRRMWLEINYRHDDLYVLHNKLSSIETLRVNGLPTLAPKAMYVAQREVIGARVLGSETEIAEFLREQEAYPMFGKPAESFNSLGSIGLSSVSNRGIAHTTDGRDISINALAAEIVSHYPEGYLFQALAVPEASLGKLHGSNRISTVRFVTIAMPSGPELFRTVWKIPAGMNVADNFWRPGNLLAIVDDTGTVEQAVSGKGFDAKWHTSHPDTGNKLVGAVHPRWDEMRNLALAGAAVMDRVPIIGWDITCTTEGPTIVEMNEFPDPFLIQFCQRRGMLDARFEAFLVHHRAGRKAFERERKNTGSAR